MTEFFSMHYILGERDEKKKKHEKEGKTNNYNINVLINITLGHPLGLYNI